MDNVPALITWRETVLNSLHTLTVATRQGVHALQASSSFVAGHVNQFLGRDMPLFHFRRRNPSPKRDFAQIADTPHEIERPAKRPSPSPSESSNSSSASKKRARETDRDDAQDAPSPPKRRSISPQKKTSSRQPSRFDNDDAAHKARMSRALQMVDELTYPVPKQINTPPQAPRPSAKSIERQRLVDELKKEQQEAATARARLKAEKDSKKKRLGAQRRKLEREHSEKSFKEAKAEYDALINDTLQRVGNFRIDDDADESSDPSVPSGKVRKRLINAVTEHWDERIQTALAVKSESAIMGKSIDGVELSRKDLGRLLPPGQLLPGREPWLNDEVINAWYSNLCAKLNEKDGYVKGPNSIPKWVAYGTQWYKSVSERGVDSIKNWSRRKGIKNEKLLQTERIFFPINDRSHWTLLTISGKHRTIEYLDSMNVQGWRSKRYISVGQQWLAMELGAGYKEEDWTILQTRTSQQCNSNDCGVFTCLNGLALSTGSKDPSLDFGSDDIPDARRMFVAVLLNGGFTGDFEL